MSIGSDVNEENTVSESFNVNDFILVQLKARKYVSYYVSQIISVGKDVLEIHKISEAEAESTKKFT